MGSSYTFAVDVCRTVCDRLEAKAAETYDSKDYYTRGTSGGSEPSFDPAGRSRW